MNRHALTKGELIRLATIAGAADPEACAERYLAGGRQAEEIRRIMDAGFGDVEQAARAVRRGQHRMPRAGDST